MIPTVYAESQHHWIIIFSVLLVLGQPKGLWIFTRLWFGALLFNDLQHIGPAVAGDDDSLCLNGPEPTITDPLYVRRKNLKIGFQLRFDLATVSSVVTRNGR
jgi:hypothetical protein